MKQITINLYNFGELSESAKEKAMQEWIKHDDLPFLEDAMDEYLIDLLIDNNIESDNAKVFYSLSYCQGDGAMFEGPFMYKGVSIVARQSGHYYHENSKDLDFDYEGLSEDDVLKTDYKMQDNFEEDFNELYIKICRELKKYGYDFIEQEQSPEHLAKLFELNEYTFKEDGTMHN